MNSLRHFFIAFTGLKPGKHQFEYQIDSSFFDAFEYSPIKKGILNAEVEFNKQETMFVLEFTIQGTVELNCDRCNEILNYELHSNEKLIFKFGEEDFDNSDEVIVLPRSDYELNVAEYIYEFINLAVPIIHIHPDLENGESGCNKEVLEVLKKLSVDTEEKNNPEVLIDPRWDALKKLRDN